MKISKLLLYILIIFIFIFNCHSKVDDEKLLEGVDYYRGLPGGLNTGNPKGELAKLINQSKEEIGFVLNNFDDEDIAQALVDWKNEKEESESEMRLIGSADRIRGGDPGFSTLENNEIKIAKNKIGRVEENFFTFDHSKCWLSTGGVSELSFSNSFNLTFVITSDTICHHFFAEARQMGESHLFSDTGEIAFGKFEHEKAKTMNVNRFYLDEYIIHIYFSAQERPLSFLFARMGSARKSIKFMAQSLTQNYVKSPQDLKHSNNRSHLLNIIQYKTKIPRLFGGKFLLEGIIDDELISPNDDCENPPDYDLDFPLSIHCGLKKAMGADIKKYVAASPLGMNLFLIDFDAEKVDLKKDKQKPNDAPIAVIMSSDFRLVEGYDITDGFLISFERRGYNSDRTLFILLNQLLDKAIAEGVDL